MTRPTDNYIIVDGACEMNPGPCEYRGVCNGNEIFRVGPLVGGTNNIAEFLAVVHALALCKRDGNNYPVYTDSQTAIAWVRNGQMKSTNHWGDHNKRLYELCNRAMNWLGDNPEHNKVIKWETKQWGENPADFGRK